VNELKLSGILGEVHCRTSPSGVPIASARLTFNWRDSILLVAVDARTRQLTAFGTGDHIRAVGRLVAYKEGFAILVDECGKWLEAKTLAKFRSDETTANRLMREVGKDLPMG
jgi:hypothetical protein